MPNRFRGTGPWFVHPAEIDILSGFRWPEKVRLIWWRGMLRLNPEHTADDDVCMLKLVVYPTEDFESLSPPCCAVDSRTAILV